MIFGRNNLSKPCVFLPGLQEPACVVASCPVLFELRNCQAGKVNVNSQRSKVYDFQCSCINLEFVLHFARCVSKNCYSVRNTWGCQRYKECFPFFFHVNEQNTKEI